MSAKASQAGNIKSRGANYFRGYVVLIIVGFDLNSCDECRKIVSDHDFNYDTIDIPTKCKIITAIIRNDRFCDGALVSAFESGLILKILKSIEKAIK